MNQCRVKSLMSKGSVPSLHFGVTSGGLVDRGLNRWGLLAVISKRKLPHLPHFREIVKTKVHGLKELHFPHTSAFTALKFSYKIGHNSRFFF